MGRAYVADALPHARLAVWREFVEEPMEALATLIVDVWGDEPLRLGIELDFLSATRFEILRARLPQVEWIAVEAALERVRARKTAGELRSEEHTSEPQSLMRISDAVFCLKKKNRKTP